MTKLDNNRPASARKHSNPVSEDELPPLIDADKSDELDEYDNYFDSEDFRSESDDEIIEFGTSLEVQGSTN